jgi:hypothetical protein
MKVHKVRRFFCEERHRFLYRKKHKMVTIIKNAEGSPSSPTFSLKFSIGDLAQSHLGEFGNPRSLHNHCQLHPFPLLPFSCDSPFKSGKGVEVICFVDILRPNLVIFFFCLGRFFRLPGSGGTVMTMATCATQKPSLTFISPSQCRQQRII